MASEPERSGVQSELLNISAPFPPLAIGERSSGEAQASISDLWLCQPTRRATVSRLHGLGCCFPESAGLSEAKGVQTFLPSGLWGIPTGKERRFCVRTFISASNSAVHPGFGGFIQRGHAHWQAAVEFWRAGNIYTDYHR